MSAVDDRLPGLPPLAERTVSAVFEQRLAYSRDKPAVRDPERSFTYGALYDEALVVAGGFDGLNVGPQEFVLLMLDNHLDFVLAWLALSLTRRVEVPVNTAYKGAILAHVINNAGARVMVVESHFLPVLLEVAERLPKLQTVVVRGEATLAAINALEQRFTVLSWASLRAKPAQPQTADPWDLIGIMYTSGTTGPSKGVRVTHAHAFGYASPSQLGGTSEHDVGLCTLPLFHIGGQWAAVYKAMIAGGSCVVLPRFSATTFWDDVRRYGCTYTMLLGAMANFLWRQPESPDDRDHHMRHIMMVPVVAHLQEFCQRFGIEAVATGYGLTEGSTVMRAPMGLAAPNKVGWPREDFEIALVDEHDRPVPEGEMGELVVRSREPWMVMDGYHDMPEATVKVWRNQWLHTGDAFRRDADGQYVFLDRMKDAMRRRGENVSSFEVEAEISAHPAVLEVAVVAVASGDTEDEIKACVVLRDGEPFEAEALLAFLDARLPYFMVPRYVEVMAELPKTPTAKIRKQELRERGVGTQTYDRAANAARLAATLAARKKT